MDRAGFFRDGVNRAIMWKAVEEHVLVVSQRDRNLHFTLVNAAEVTVPYASNEEAHAALNNLLCGLDRRRAAARQGEDELARRVDRMWNAPTMPGFEEAKARFDEAAAAAAAPSCNGPDEEMRGSGRKNNMRSGLWNQSQGALEAEKTICID